MSSPSEISFARKTKLTFWGIAHGYLLLIVDGKQIVLENKVSKDGTGTMSRFMRFIIGRVYWDKGIRGRMPKFLHKDRLIEPLDGFYINKELNELS